MASRSSSGAGQPREDAAKAGAGVQSGARSLADDLRIRTDAELEELLRSRPDLATPLPADITQLATRSTSRVSVSRALDRMDRFHLQVLEAVALLPEPVTLTAVVDAMGLGEHLVEPVLANLRKQVLLWQGPDGLHPSRTLLEVIGPTPAGLGPPAQQILAGTSPARLATLARELGRQPTGDPVGDATAIAALLGDEAQLGALLERVGDRERALLDALAVGPPFGRLGQLDASLGASPTGGTDDTDAPRGTHNSVLSTLVALGLLVPIDSETVALPREVGRYLRGGHTHADAAPNPPAPAAAGKDATLVDKVAGGNALAALRHFETLLEAWGSEPPAVLRSGGLGVRDLKRAAALLDVDEPTAALIIELAWVSGLIASDAESRWLPTPAYDMWHRDEPGHRWATIASAWLITSRVPALVGGRDDRDKALAALGPDVDRAAAPEIRRDVLTALADLPPGGVATPNELINIVAWRRPRRIGASRDSLVHWTTQEAELLGVTGRGALSSAGRLLVTVTPPRAHADATRSVREQWPDRETVDALAEAMSAQLPEQVGHVLVQADLTAIAPGPLHGGLSREMALMADIESTGGATVYRFSPESVRRAFDAGRTAAEVHGFLAEISRTPVPQPLSYLVDDVARRHGAMRVGASASFLRSDDTTALDALMADPKATSLLLRRLAPTVLASQVSPERVLERLRTLGYAPAAEASDGSVVSINTGSTARAPARPKPSPLRSERPTPPETVLKAAVRALRAGDRTAAARPVDATPPQLARSASTDIVKTLREACAAAGTVWIGYVDNHGRNSERLIDPVRVDGGWLTAYDHRADAMQSFAIHRISAVASVASH